MSRAVDTGNRHPKAQPGGGNEKRTTSQVELARQDDESVLDPLLNALWFWL